jgi:ParB-like chromosome segregation protein Spo0J
MLTVLVVALTVCLRVVPKNIPLESLIHKPVHIMWCDRDVPAGARRLEACKRLGFNEIPCTVLDLDNGLQAEHDENMVRMDFLPSEAVAIKKALEPLERERARRRMVQGGRGVNLTQVDKGKSRDQIASKRR